jgi:hypothetical protein
MTLEEARVRGWDVEFHPTREDAEPAAAAFTRVTGREAVAFEEEATCGGFSYTLFAVACSPRPRPVVRLVTT